MLSFDAKFEMCSLVLSFFLLIQTFLKLFFGHYCDQNISTIFVILSIYYHHIVLQPVLYPIPSPWFLVICMYLVIFTDTE